MGCDAPFWKGRKTSTPIMHWARSNPRLFSRKMKRQLWKAQGLCSVIIILQKSNTFTQPPSMKLLEYVSCVIEDLSEYRPDAAETIIYRSNKSKRHSHILNFYKGSLPDFHNKHYRAGDRPRFRENEPNCSHNILVCSPSTCPAWVSQSNKSRHHRPFMLNSWASARDDRHEGFKNITRSLCSIH